MSLFPIEEIRTCSKCSKRYVHTSNEVGFDLGNSKCEQCNGHVDYEFTTHTSNNNSGIVLSYKTEGENYND